MQQQIQKQNNNCRIRLQEVSDVLISLPIHRFDAIKIESMLSSTSDQSIIQVEARKTRQQINWPTIHLFMIFIAVNSIENWN